MQFKALGDVAHISGSLRLMWNRISFTKLTLFYFCFSFVHFVIQVSLQIKAFTINADAASILGQIVDAAGTTNNSLPSLKGNILRMCSWVPANLNVDVVSCPVVWNGTAAASATSGINANAVGINNSVNFSSAIPLSSTASVVQSSPSTSAASVTISSTQPSAYLPEASTLASSASILSSASPTATSTNPTQTITIFTGLSIPTASQAADTPFDGLDEHGLSNSHHDTGFNEGFKYRRDLGITLNQTENSVSVTLVGIGSNPITLSNSCLWSLNWPLSTLRNTKREDIVFIGFQIWVLGMSLVALLNESIPHILASLATHMIATGWAAFQIQHTAQFREDFNRVITNGACDASLLPHYWDARAKAELPSLALNILGLFISAFLTWKLIKLFGWQTFKRVGASLSINRIYKFVLLLSVTIQLSLFFMIVTVSLWVDQLMNSVIGDLASYQKLYKVASLITLALMIPWLMTGWFAVRRELKVPMLVFLLLSVCYLGVWGIMFISTTFKWTFITWTFFSIMATTSVALTVLSITLGLVCRFNFGKGLARYLNAHQQLEDDEVQSQYPEKVAFPSSDQPLPTYAYSISEKDSHHSASYMQGGPRFSNKSAAPFETVPGSVAYPAAALSRGANDLQLHRSDSYGSTRSAGSSLSSDSHHSHSRSDSGHSRTGQKQRWIIE
jgi:hypothetical protein